MKTGGSCSNGILLLISCIVLNQITSAWEVVLIDVQGETQYNYLRHCVAVSNTGDTYGKQGSTLLGRNVVSTRGIWNSVDHVTKSFFERPEALDWYIADVGTDGDPRTVTINAGFSCYDLGLSNSAAITWWVAKGPGLSKETKLEPGVGGIEIETGGTNGSVNDILIKCWELKKYEKGRRFVEHADQHRGTGDRMFKATDNIDRPKSIVGENSAFTRLHELRMSMDRSDVVVYDKSGLGVVMGLPFDSGFRIFAEDNMTEEISREFKVPMTPYGGLTTHMRARLRESRVARGESRTSKGLLLLTVWASGLAFLLAVWIMAKTITDILVEHSKKLRMTDVHTAVQGTDGWTVGEKVTLVTNFIAVTILLTPFGQAIAEGHIDPREAIEVHYGANIYYTDSGMEPSDPDNPIAGALFFVSTWITVRPLDEGFAISLALSLFVILLFAYVILMQVSKKSSEMMRSSGPVFPISTWKLLGYLRMWGKALRGRNRATYKVFLHLREDMHPLSNGECPEDSIKEVALLCDGTWRARANTTYRPGTVREVHEATLHAARDAAHEAVRGACGSGCTGLVARVRLDDRTRFEAATAGTAPWQNAMCREWEYVRRGTGCESLEWYRTNGQFPPDEVLALVRMGVLQYARFVGRICVAREAEGAACDGDGVRCVVVVGGKEGAEWGDEAGEWERGVPRFVVVRGQADMPAVLRGTVESRAVEARWTGGSGGPRHVSYAASSMVVRYIVAGEA